MLYAIKHGSEFYVSTDLQALGHWAHENLPRPRHMGEPLDGYYIETLDPALMPVLERDGFRFRFPV